MRSAIPTRSAVLPGVLALCAMALAGCGNLGGLSAVGVACPAVPPYDAAFRASLAAEVDRLAADDPLRTALGDYLLLRAQAQACAKS